jgi:quercetin dioxygenase-like cupin family protein
MELTGSTSRSASNASIQEISMTVISAIAATPAYAAAIKTRHSTRASGDFAVVGATLQPVGERLGKAVDLRRLTFASLAAAVMLALPMAARAGDVTHGVTSADKMAWGLLDPKQPNGIQVAVLYGDPSKSGPFGLRLKIPASLEIGSHSHSSAEYITVVSGKAKVSWGIKADVMGGDDIGPGSFFWMKSGDHHDLKALEETIVDINSTGPFDLIPNK